MRRFTCNCNRQSIGDAQALRTSRGDRPRRGAALIVVMICLLGIAMLAGSLLRLAVAQHRQARMHHRRLQVEWLAAAGVERALVRLSTDSNWQGEEWAVPAEMFGAAAHVTLAMEATNDSRREIVSVATIAPDSSGQVRITRRRSLPAAASTPEETP